MKQLLAISRRETGAFFRSAMAPLVLLGWLILVGLFFTLFTYGYSELWEEAQKAGRIESSYNMAEGIFQPLIADLAIFLLFLLPAVSMRLFSSEYRSGRYDLVMSYPVADHVWVTGKFLSVMAVACVLIAAGGLYVVVAAWLGHPEPGPLVAAVIGLVLLAGAIAAWGIFFSALQQYQVVSYFLCFAFVLLWFVAGSFGPYLPRAFERLCGELSWQYHFLRFSWGVVDSRDAVFFLSWIGLGLTAATAALTGHRLAIERRPLRWLPTVLLAAFLVIVNVLAARYPVSADWTSNKRYSLAPQTVQVLEALQKDVKILAFYQRLDPQRKAVEVLLRAIRDHSPRIQYQMVDLDRELALVEHYGLEAARTVVVDVGQKHSILLEPDESPLINAIWRLATGTHPVVYHLQGHGEHLLDSDDRGGYANYATELVRQGYEVRPLLTVDDPSIPTDADIVVISAPKLDLTVAEVDALQEFIATGGAVCALLDPGVPPSVADWVARYNVGLGDDFIVSLSKEQRQYGVDPRVVIIADEYGEHPLTKGMRGIATMFPFVQSLGKLHAGQVGVRDDVILRTGLFSWAERDPMTVAAGEPKFDEESDVRGPIDFGVALEVQREQYFAAAAPSDGPRREEPEPSDDPMLRRLQQMHGDQKPTLPPSIFTQEATSRIVIIGDSDFAANANLGFIGNRDFLLNIISWLARERVLIEVRARAGIGEPLVLTTGQKEAIGWGSILGWPLLVTGASVMMVLRHRRRR